MLSAGLVVCSAAQGQFDGSPDTATPDGPAALSSPWLGAVNHVGISRAVLVGWEVTVGAGGNGGPVRLIATSPEDPTYDVTVGPWVALPAQPGRYRFPAPHVTWDALNRTGLLELEQQVGGHVIVEREPCHPGDGMQPDPCANVQLDVERDGTVVESRAGERLTLRPLIEFDLDGDRVGDETEDRTDLRLTTRRDGGRLRITVRNRGPRIASRVVLTVSPKRARCEEAPYLARIRLDWCRMYRLGRLLRGAQRRVMIPASRRRSLEVVARSEGPDLRPRDNTRWVPAR